MSVDPGFGGQSFIESQCEKIRRIRSLIGRRPVHLEVDGGISPVTAMHAVEAGADVLVAGSAVFKGGTAKHYRQNIDALRAAAHRAASAA